MYPIQKQQNAKRGDGCMHEQEGGNIYIAVIYVNTAAPFGLSFFKD